MLNIDKGLNVAGKSSKAGAFWTAFGLMIAGLFVGQFAAFMLMIVFGVSNGLAMEDMLDTVTLNESLSQVQFYLSQSSYTIIFCFATAWLYLKMNRQKGFSVLSKEKGVPLVPALLAFAATFAFLFVNSWLVEWNSGITLPEAFSELEKTLKDLEAQMAEATEKLTTFNHFGTFLLAFIVVAVLPGIGEELLFRGVLQNTLHRYSGNKHVAIWVTGFLFAAIHFQFYGLVPRTMLGVLFGYIYVWSGNLKMAMVAHIANNGLALCFAYYAQLTEMDIDIDDPDTISGWVSLVGLVVTIALLFVFRNYYLRAKPADEQVADDLSD